MRYRLPLLLMALLLSLGCVHGASQTRELARFQERALLQHDRVFFLAAQPAQRLQLDKEGRQALGELRRADAELRARTRALVEEAPELTPAGLRLRLTGLDLQRMSLASQVNALYAEVIPRLVSSAQVTLGGRDLTPAYLELVKLEVRVDGRTVGRALGLGTQARGIERVSLPPGQHVVRAHAWFRGHGASPTGTVMKQKSFVVVRAMGFAATGSDFVLIDLYGQRKAGLDHEVPAMRIKLLER